VGWFGYALFVIHEQLRLLIFNFSAFKSFTATYAKITLLNILFGGGRLVFNTFWLRLCSKKELSMPQSKDFR
jgi:hypothetical protein